MTDTRTIDKWEIDGRITPELLHEWAYDENAVFMEQDEDLLLHDVELLPTIIKLIADKNCPKRVALFGIISYFTTLNFRHKRDIELKQTKEIVSKLSILIREDSDLSKWTRYYEDTEKLISSSKNINKDIAEKFGWAILKGLNGSAELTSPKQVDNSTWEVIYLAASVKPFIHIDIKTGEFKYMGYK